ncbi:MAG: DUF488 domain-containing protein, partial [Candidatus Helarchaeota archaeon]|nr:DUF488 domain-containing protein [Candidatus Helarchaeota archaeon]
MEIYTIGFTKKPASKFFGELKRVGIKQLIDVRLNNSSQLAGFTKKNDLIFFLREICDASYFHEPLLAPTSEILTSYKKKKITWQDYEKRFLDLMIERKVEEKINRNIFDQLTVLLCSESTAEHCHRRLVLEYLQ